MSEPILIKRDPTKNSYKLLTWILLLKLIEIAKDVANDIGYPVYLVGSVLQTDKPRDIDISVVMPLAEYEKRYGEISKDPRDRTGNLHVSFAANVEHAAKFISGLNYEYDIDFKVCPDTWWTGKPKLLLAEPNIKAI